MPGSVISLNPKLRYSQSRNALFAFTHYSTRKACRGLPLGKICCRPAKLEVLDSHQPPIPKGHVFTQRDAEVASRAIRLPEDRSFKASAKSSAE